MLPEQDVRRGREYEMRCCSEIDSGRLSVLVDTRRLSNRSGNGISNLDQVFV